MNVIITYFFINPSGILMPLKWDCFKSERPLAKTSGTIVWFLLMHPRPHAFSIISDCTDWVRELILRSNCILHHLGWETRNDCFIDHWLSGYRAHWRSLKNKQDAKVSFYWSDAELVNLFAVGLWVIIYWTSCMLPTFVLRICRILWWSLDVFPHAYHSVRNMSGWS